MSTDFEPFQGVQTSVRIQVLRILFSILELTGKDINAFHLFDYRISHDDGEFLCNELNDELAIITQDEDLSSSTTFNDAQQHAYDSILQKVFSFESIALFVDEPVGT